MKISEVPCLRLVANDLALAPSIIAGRNVFQSSHELLMMAPGILLCRDGTCRIPIYQEALAAFALSSCRGLVRVLVDVCWRMRAQCSVHAHAAALSSTVTTHSLRGRTRDKKCRAQIQVLYSSKSGHVTWQVTPSRRRRDSATTDAGVCHTYVLVRVRVRVRLHVMSCHVMS